MAQNGAMRILAALVALAACAAAHAQRMDGATSGTVRPPQYREREDLDERRTPEPTRPTSKKMDGSKPAPITSVGPVERDEWQERERRRREQNLSKQSGKTPEPKASTKSAGAKSAKAMDGPAPLTSVRPAPSAPSPAEQMQRRMNEERGNQRGERAQSASGFRCQAYPVCNRSSGSYGSCRGVEQLYTATSSRSARQQIERACAAANNPDPCNCAAQCSRVAQCGPI